MPRRKPIQLTILTRNGERGERAIAKRDRSLDFGERWSYAPAPEAHSYIKLHDRYQLFIGGKFVAPKSGDYFDSVNPATEEKLAEISFANEKDVDRAVKAARRAYKNVWSKNAGPRTGKYLFRIARLIQEKARELPCSRPWTAAKPSRNRATLICRWWRRIFFTTRAGPTNSTTLFPGGKLRTARRRGPDHSLEFSRC
jgi:aldehyde dehydrogenase (NAD+)